MKLRPHHLLDILRSYGHGVRFGPHPYGHAIHSVAPKVLSNVDRKVEFVLGSDAICQPCAHLQPDGLCDDVLHQLDPPIRKQEYNDGLDRRLFARFGFAPGTVMTVRAFLEIVSEKVPGIEKICTHPKEDETARLDGLVQGLVKLGIRNAGQS